MPKLTAERARELFSYDPLTGVLTRRAYIRGHKVGAVVGCVTSEGYRSVTTGGSPYRVHRVIWLMAYGAWPENTIDHINGDKLDNRLANLRDVSRRTNKENMRAPRIDNQSGFLGVYWHKHVRKFQTSIRTCGKLIHLGYYTTPEEAHQAYLTAKRQLHAGCTI